MAHMNSVFLGALFTYMWYTTLGKRTKLQWTLLGAILGMIYLVRQQEILFGLLVAFELLQKLLLNRTVNELLKSVKNGLAFSAGTITLLIPQIFVWKALHGRYLVYSYATTNQYWHWTMPQLLPFFLSPVDGMWRIPLMVLGIIGMLMFAARVKGLSWYFAAILIGEVVVTAAWTGWNVGYGFRFLLGTSAFIALGNAEIISRLLKNTKAIVVYAILAILIAANIVNMTTFLLGEVSSKVPVTDVPRLIMNALF
jgi:hypothetical protein